MQIFYSAAENGFFRPDIRQLPEDAVEVSLDVHATMVAGLAEGKRWVPGPAGQPVLVPVALTVAEAVGALTAACAACIIGGFRSAALGAEHIYPSRQTDQINLMGSVTGSLLPDLPSDWTTPFWCADEAGVWAFRAHTAAQIQQAGAAGKAHVVACQAALAELSAAVLAAPSEEALRQVLWVDPPSAAAL